MRPLTHGLPLSLAALTLLVGPLWADKAGDADSKPAVLIIHLPADAELYIGGSKCKQTGDTREFDTPPLPPGKKFSYQIKAYWKEDGKEVTHIAKAVVRAGETTKVDLLEPPPKVAEGPKKPARPAEEKKPQTEPEEKPVPEPVVKEPAPEPAGSFELEVSDARLSVKPGETRLLAVRVRRNHFKEPVQLRFTGVPARVAVEKAMLAGDEDRAHVQVSAADDAPASETVIGVVASGGKITTEGSFTLLVVRPAEPGPKANTTATLALHAPETLTLEPGQEKLLPVKVIRSHFQGPVAVKIEGLPPGVEVREATVAASKDKVYLAASAADGAGATECQARLIATSGKVRREAALTVKISRK